MTEKFVDFRTVKQHVSIEQVLEHYNIRLRRTNKNSLRGFCPLPTHTSEKSRESFGVNVEKKIWACQSSSCANARQGKKGGNILDLVAVMESCTVREAALKLDDWFVRTSTQNETPKVQTSEMSDEQKSAERKLVAEKREEVTTGNRPLSFALSGIDSTHPYFQHRGITEETAKHFGVGFFPGRGSMNGRVVIPIANERGELVAYAGRAIGDTEPKYKFPAGFRKSEVLWNLNRVLEHSDFRKFVVVVEGFFDCMKVHQAGFQNVVALMGSSMSEAQQKMLADFDRVVLFLDGDDAGRQGATNIALQLMFGAFVNVVQLPPDRQPDQLTSEEIQAVLGKI